jgi:hypothetical protein
MWYMNWLISRDGLEPNGQIVSEVVHGLSSALAAFPGSCPETTRIAGKSVTLDEFKRAADAPNATGPFDATGVGGTVSISSLT